LLTSLFLGFYAKEWKVDMLRLCFGNGASDKVRDQVDRECIAKLESIIDKELKRLPMVLRGHDRESRVILHRYYPSYRASNEEEGDLYAYTLAMLYMAEKAVACSEALSRGRESKVVAILEYGDHVPAHASPMHFTKYAVAFLRANYPNQAAKIFVLDAPLWMRGFYCTISPFLPQQTREKVCTPENESIPLPYQEPLAHFHLCFLSDSICLG
jgi:hypothetical protein